MIPLRNRLTDFGSGWREVFILLSHLHHPLSPSLSLIFLFSFPLWEGSFHGWLPHARMRLRFPWRCSPPRFMHSMEGLRLPFGRLPHLHVFMHSIVGLRFPFGRLPHLHWIHSVRLRLPFVRLPHFHGFMMIRLWLPFGRLLCPHTCYLSTELKSNLAKWIVVVDVRIVTPPASLLLLLWWIGLGYHPSTMNSFGLEIWFPAMDSPS